ncbi:uncharacterized protein LOC141614018 [Silene latifolia]|uniref:uncharacterized protein LOC141614018 n=1 Tax=Silene latifolia TaxID=37657 RepID=UPI003D76DF8C
MVFQGWQGLCRPRHEGGLDIKEVLSWNKCQMLRWVWKICYKPESLWASWFSHYVLKGASIWSATSTVSHSWFWKSVIQVKDYLIQFVGSPTRAVELLASCSPNGKLDIGGLYELFRPKATPVTWGRTLHDPAIIPKHAVIGAMAVTNKLPTVDNIKSRGMCMANRCVLCMAAEETMHHLFFNCPYSKLVWTEVCTKLCSLLPPCTLVHLLQWLRERNRGRARDKVRRSIAFACAIYEVWKKRNKRIFRGQCGYSSLPL